MIRAILFDKDGTLTDFRATWEAWMSGMVLELAEAARASPEAIGDAIGYDLERGEIRADGMFVTATEHATAVRIAGAVGWELPRLESWIGGRIDSVPQVAVPGAAETLATLARAGLPLGVLTNADLAEAERHLAQMDMRRFVGRIIACDSGFGAKPDPRGAADFADRLGLDRAEVLLVGDGLADLSAAHGSGLRAVAVLTGTQDAAALSGAEAVLPDVTHLPGWLATENGRIFGT